jgi:pimeloyl-ACP methyl ester carboxylesterase
VSSTTASTESGGRPFDPGLPGPGSLAGPPALPLYLTEPARAAAEFGWFLACAPLLPALPHGDGHPVLVLPGLLATDSSTGPLRRILRRLGYPVEGWLLGRNLGPTSRVAAGLSRRLDDLVQHHGRTVSLVGWSLGGVYARVLARQDPAAVRQVITLGSPFQLARSDQTRAHQVFERYSHMHVERWQLPLEDERTRLAVPATSIYSVLDGVVHWRACLDRVSPLSENIEVYGSHLGLGHHPAVVWAVADRLAQPEGAWSPFRPPAPLRPAYPRPRSAS